MYFIVASNYDGPEVFETTDKSDAEQFCVKFLAEHKDNAGAIMLAVRGVRLDAKVIEVVKSISLEDVMQL